MRVSVASCQTADCAAAPQFARLAGAGDQLSYPQNQARMGAFLQGLQQLGWIDGSSVRIDTRWPAGDAADTRKYAAELVALWPDKSRATERRSLHVGFSRKRPSAAVSHRAASGESQDTTADPESSKSGNGDLQHLREMTLRSA